MKACGPLVDPVCPRLGLAHLPSFPQAQLIAQSIGQAFSVAYQEFLRANGINPEDLSQKEYSDIINTQEMYNDDLIHFSNSENCKEVSHIAGVSKTFSSGHCSPKQTPPLRDGPGGLDVEATSAPPHLSSPGKTVSKASFLTPVCVQGGDPWGLSWSCLGDRHLDGDDTLAIETDFNQSEEP